jgi:ATP-binding cassette, subfamily A (ABC1), member 3
VLLREKQIEVELIIEYLEIAYIANKTAGDITQLFG